MNYSNPEIESSYQPNNLGKTLYDEVIRLKPKKVIDFGVLNGYSLVCIAQALRDLGEGKVYGYDLFEKYEYKHATQKKVIKNLKKYGIENYAQLTEKNFFDWLKENEDFDMLHVDISNTGDIIDLLWEKFKGTGKVIIFEGGDERRDKVGWMVIYNKKPITHSKAKFTIINKLFPSISKLNT